MPSDDAKEHFGEHLKKKQAPAEGEGPTVGRLFSSFLTWAKENDRSDSQYRRRKRDCSRFARFVFGGRRLAGTSVRMIETVYGHFRTDYFADAQRRLDDERKKRLANAKQTQEVTTGRGARSPVAAPAAGEEQGPSPVSGLPFGSGRSSRVGMSFISMAPAGTNGSNASGKRARKQLARPWCSVFRRAVETDAEVFHGLA